jgi:hypothetical protein
MNTALKYTIRVLWWIGTFYLSFYLLNKSSNWYINNYLIYDIDKGVKEAQWYLFPNMILVFIAYVLIIIGINLLILKITEYE